MFYALMFFGLAAYCIRAFWRSTRTVRSLTAAQKAEVARFVAAMDSVRDQCLARVAITERKDKKS